MRIVHNYNLRHHEEEMAFKTKYLGSIYFASWGNSSTGALLPSDKQNCL